VRSGHPYPTRHIRTYPVVQSAYACLRTGGEAGARHVLKVRCAMPAQGPQRPADRPLSEVTFLTVAEVAAVMRVSKMTVYRLVHAGTLPAVRVGRSFRVPEKAVHDYLDQSYVETA
jgi:excisionase family DNA binding protein